MHVGQWIPHWFDILTLAALGLGIYCGRRRGISGELPYLLQWIAIVVVCGMLHQTAGRSLGYKLHISPNTGCVLVYIALAFAVKGAFGFIHRAVGNKLVKRDLFGKWEYYLGVIGGMARFLCILLMGLALLSSKYITYESLYSLEMYQKENFGGITFPTISEMKNDSLTQSFSGKLAKNWFNNLLIESIPPTDYSDQWQPYRYEDDLPKSVAEE